MAMSIAPSNADRWLIFVFVLALDLVTTGATGQDRSPVRDVTPAGVARIFQSIPSVTAAATPREKFVNVQLRNDGSLRAGGKDLKLLGITFPSRTKICGQPNEKRWACGLRAHGAARLAMDQKVLECEKHAADVDPRLPISVTCWIQGINLALMLLEQGWVYLSEDPGDQKVLWRRLLQQGPIA